MTRVCFAAFLAFWVVTLGGSPPWDGGRDPGNQVLAAPGGTKHHSHGGHHRKTQNRIRVTVVGHDGRPVAGATVLLRKVHRHKKQQGGGVAGVAHAPVVKTRIATTNWQGHATFRHLPPGHYRAVAYKKGLGIGSVKTTLRAGQSQSLTILLAHHH
jgi:hypothetical protein